MVILKFRYVFHIKLMCRHQNKTCQNGVGPDLTKRLLLNRGRKGKPTPFWKRLDTQKTCQSGPKTSRTYREN